MKGSKKLTVRQLRELARKYLGRGHSKLKKKAELLAALKKWLPEVLHAARSPRRKRNTPSPKRSAPHARKSLPAASRTAPVEVVTFARVEEARPPARPAQTPTAPRQQRVIEKSVGVNGKQRLAEPIIEGFFIARVAGEGEARRHHLVEGAARIQEPKVPLDDALGELPSAYGNDSLRALPRDPTTLFVSWDFHQHTLDRAAAGLRSPRAVLRLLSGDSLVRVAEVALESRSFYFHGLTPGARYLVEAHWVGLDGDSKLIARAKDEVELPIGGDALQPGAARFVKLRWDQPLGGLDAGPDATRIMSNEEAGELARKMPRSRADSASDRSRWTLPPAARVIPQEEAEELARKIPRSRADSASDRSHWTPPPSGQF